MRVLVCGGRNYNNKTALFEAMDNIVTDRGVIHLLIHGAASGAGVDPGEGRGRRLARGSRAEAGATTRGVVG